MRNDNTVMNPIDEPDDETKMMMELGITEHTKQMVKEIGYDKQDDWWWWFNMCETYKLFTKEK